MYLFLVASQGGGIHAEEEFGPCIEEFGPCIGAPSVDLGIGLLFSLAILPTCLGFPP